MATVGPVLVSDTTNTSGTGSLSLNNASSDGRRGLADAVTNGDAANTNTVHYLILDSGTSGGGLDFEKGVGTISDAGATLSRDTVHQSSNAGAKVSWPSGGTRDVLVAVGLEDLLVAANNLSDLASAATSRTNLAAAGTGDANTFTQDQKVKKSASAGRLRVGSDLSSGDTAGLAFIGNNSSASETQYALIRQVISDATAGSEDGSVQFFAMLNGSNTQVFQYDATNGLRTAAGNKYDAFPAGTKLLFGTTPPAGWTRANVTGERVIRLAGTSDTIGTQAGSWTISGLSLSGSTDGTALTVSQAPSHSHVIHYSKTTVNGDTGAVNPIVMADIEASASDGSGSTQTSGSGSAHSHTLSGSASVNSSGSWRPAYEIAAWATKN